MRQIVFLVSILGVIFAAKFAKADGGQTQFYCLDMSCHDVISIGKTLLLYSGRTDKHLSFKKNEDISILSKPTDKSGNDWVGKIRGKIGLIPKDMMREDKMNKPTHPEIYKYPLEYLPLWNDPLPHLEPEPTPDEDDNESDAEDSQEDINATLSEVPTSTSSRVSEEKPVEKNDDKSAGNEVYDDINSTSNEVPQVVQNEQVPGQPLEPQNVDVSTAEIPDMQPVAPVETVNKVPRSLERDDEEPERAAPQVENPEASASSSDSNKEVKSEIESNRAAENNVEEESTDIGKEETSAEDQDQDDEATKSSSTLTDWFGFSDGDDEDDDAAADEEDEVNSTVKEVPQGAEIPEEKVIEQPVQTPEPNIAATKITDEHAVEPSATVERNEGFDQNPENLAKSEPEVPPAEQVPESASIPASVSNADATESIPFLIESKTTEQSANLNPKSDHGQEQGEGNKKADESNDADEDDEEDDESDNESEVQEDKSQLLDSSADIEQSSESEQKAEVTDQGPNTKSEVNEPEPVITDPSVESLVASTATEEGKINIQQVQQGGQIELSANENAGPTNPVQNSVVDDTNNVESSENRGQVSPPNPSENSEQIQIPDDSSRIPPVNPANDASHIHSSDNLVHIHSDNSAPVQTIDDANANPDTNVPVSNEINNIEKPEQVAGGENFIQVNKFPNYDQVQSTESSLNVEHEITPESTTVSSSETPEVLIGLPLSQDVPEKISSEPESHSGHSHHSHSHSHNRDHGHSHNYYSSNESGGNETSSIILVVKHLSSTLLSFLPEHLQDTILDVDDALVFTGIIALTLVSICVPYFFIEGFMSVRPLKKKVVELNKSLWKVSTAYENQQEEFEIFKKKALDYDEDKKRVDQLEAELAILKNLEAKQKEQVKNLKKELKSSAKIATEVENLVVTTMEMKAQAVEERDKLKTAVMSLQEALNKTTEQLEVAQTEASTYSIDLELAKHTNENLNLKITAAENEMLELKAKIKNEIEIRQLSVAECEVLSEEKTKIQEELVDLKEILHKYEKTVSNLNQEIGQKENELMILKESLGEDSPLVDIAEIQAKLKYVEDESIALQSRIDSVTLEKNSLSRNFEQTTKKLECVQSEKEHASNRLLVLEAWFKEKEDELRTAVSKYEAEKNIRGKDKDDLVKMIEEKADEVRDLTERLEALKDEFEDTKLQYRNEIRAMEAKSHENWLSLCQAERKAQDARKDAELLRQKLTAITKEKGGDESEIPTMNGEVPFYSMIPPELVPPPIPEIPPSYFGLGDDFLPPPPLPLDGEREPLRPPPLGRLSPTWNSDLEDNPLSPIRRRGRRDYSDGSSRSGSRSPPRGPPSSRGNWSDRDRPPHHDFRRNNDLPGSSSGHNLGHGPKASSPIQYGANL